MRAEDLFEAMGTLDEQLIALSEEDSRRAREAESGNARKEANKRKAKMRKRAEIYRFAAVAMTTAAAVFIVLTARDLLGARSRSMSENAAASSEYSLDESVAEEAAQDTLAGGALGIEADEAAEPDAGTVSKYSAAQDSDVIAEDTAPDAEEASPDALAASPEASAPAAEAAADRDPKAAKKDIPEEEAESEALRGAGKAESGVPAAESASEEAAPSGAGDAGDAAQPEQEASEAAGKTAVDLLGENKGDYVKLEIISAKDKASGGETTVPEYTPEREKALTAALENGRKMPTLLVRIGAPIYYVYLTDSKGNVDTVTFYEHGYVGINTIPGFVMELSNEAFEAVKEVFE